MIRERVSFPALRLARVVVAGAIVGAPLAQAVLISVDGVPFWPTLLALALGTAARVAWPRSVTPVLAAVALGPVWQLATGVITGSPDLARLMPWLAALGVWLAWPPAPAPAWSVTGLWRLGIVTWALVLAVALPVTALRELDFTLQTIGVPTSNGSFGMTPHLSAATVALAVQAQLVALLLFDWLWGAGAATRRRVWLALAPGVALACALATWQLGDPAFLSAAPWIGLARAAGPFYDANAMGALAALVAAALAGPGLRPSAIAPGLWSGAWGGLALAGVAASGSRTALGALLVSGVVAGLAALRPRARVAAVAMLLAVGLVAARLAPASGERPDGHAVGRLAGTLRRVIAGGPGVLLRVAWGRDGYGPASQAVIADHPWVGVGPGVLGNVISDYGGEVSPGQRLPPDNAQNWWRQQLAELGVAGGAAPVFCSILALVALLRAWRRPGDAAAHTAPLVALGLMAIVSPPTQHPVIQVLAGLLTAQAVAPRDEPPDTATPPVRSSRSAAITGAVAWTLALACGLGLAVDGWTAFRPPHRAARFHFAYDYGLVRTVPTPLGQARWAARHSVTVFRPDHRVLFVQVALPHTDLATSPVTVTVSDGHQVLCREERRGPEPFECRMIIPDDRWPIVEVAVSRPWFTAGGQDESALLSGRYARDP